ncbi:MAG: TetR/AcrR family transcriptional regulator, partial [Muriicola sp.]|nr:TetR/AcrR family transcriptional regulator [Muriicola sp.]
KQFSLMKGCVVDNIKRGIAMGIYIPTLNVDFIARIYFSGVTSIKDHTLFPEDEFPKTQLMDDYLEYHLRGIVTSQGRQILNDIIHSNQK